MSANAFAPVLASLSLPDPQTFLAGFRRNLRDRRFWVVQAMVLAVTGSHFIVEIMGWEPPGHLEPMYFVPASLYFFPVLYASLNFGREGAVPTALWSAFLALPNIIFWHHGGERFGEAFQLGTVVILATIVASRVDREILARRIAEEIEAASRLSQIKYHSIFENAGQAILVFDRDGTVREANAAAGALFSRPTAELKDASLKALIGPAGVKEVRGSSGIERWTGREFELRTADAELWLEPFCSRLPAGDDGLVLVLFKDVTARRGFQSYARAIVHAQEDERQRIARDLHDISLQSVVLLCRRLDEVEDAASEELPPDVSAALGEARQLAEAIGGELRRFSRDLRPSVLDDLGLVPAVRNLLSELGERTGIQTRFVLTGTPSRLHPSAEVSLFRISQESLRNIEKHAGASRVTLRLQLDPDKVLLSITDNGKGFQMAQSMTSLATAGRLGLVGMSERAILAGGTCAISSQPGKGTRVSVRIPTGAAHDFVSDGAGLATAQPAVS